MDEGKYSSDLPPLPPPFPRKRLVEEGPFGDKAPFLDKKSHEPSRMEATEDSFAEERRSRRRLADAIVFSTLALLGGALFALIVFTNLNWIYPAVFYGIVVYIAWDRFFPE